MGSWNLSMHREVLRATTRNYQLDMEIAKKWPGLKLSRNKALGTQLQKRWFKSDRLNNIFLFYFLIFLFFLPDA